MSFVCSRSVRGGGGAAMAWRVWCFQFGFRASARIGPNNAHLSNRRPPGRPAVATNWLRSWQAKKTTPTGLEQREQPFTCGSADTMSTDPAAAPAPKRARTPYRPPLLSLWARNDLADSVVAFLPGTNLSKMPVISKGFRAAQPLVLFTAARRLKVLDRAQDAFLGVLREVTPELRWFRETWTGGLARWQGISPHGGLRSDIVGSPPHLRLRGTHGDHIGLSHRLPRSDERSLAVKHFRAQVTFPEAVSGATGYVWLCRDSRFEGCDAIAGIYGCYREDDETGMDALDQPGVLRWIAVQQDENGEWGNECTELCTAEPDVCYEITASFSDKDDDGLMIATVTVTPRGQPPFATISIRCRAGDLDAVHIYNFHDGEAHIGELEVGYESEDDDYGSV